MIKNIVTDYDTYKLHCCISYSDWNRPVLILQNIALQEQPLGKLTFPHFFSLLLNYS